MLIKALGTASLVALVGLIMLWSPVTSSACGCGSWTGPTIAAGTTPGGVTWKISAVHHGHRNFARDFSIEFDYFLESDDLSDYGFGYGPHSVRATRLASGVPGFGFGPEKESDVAGVVHWRTKELVIVMKSGKRIRFKPVAAPAKLRRRWPWIKALRFYDQFFKGTQNPVRVVALNASGKVMARQRL